MKLENKKRAYTFCGKDYTWGDIDKASDRIMHALSELGMKEGSHVAICAPNSINWVFCFYAIQKLGGVAVLINPGLTPEEILKLTRIADVSCLCYAEKPGIMTFAQFCGSMEGSADLCVYDISSHVDFLEDMDVCAGASEIDFDVFLSKEKRFMIFSSGSTGDPKAVLSAISHTAVNIETMVKEVRFSEKDVNLAFLPFFHIFGLVTGILLEGMTGCSAVIPEHRAPDLLIKLIERYGCTTFFTVPAMMGAILQSKTFAPEKFHSLRFLLLGGALSTEKQITQIHNCLPELHICNIYGMSENAAISMTRYEESVEHLSRTVGRIVPGIEVRIRDTATGQPLAAGQTGEICIRSPYRGEYYSHFAHGEIADENGWWATGDMGIMDADGYLHIVGRKKELIISGGENISPEEIAAAIMRFSEVLDVKVMGIPDERMGEVVAAALIPKEQMRWNEAEVREHLSQHLAKYKIPTYFVTVDVFPLLGSGKVDGRALRETVIKRLKEAAAI